MRGQLILDTPEQAMFLCSLQCASGRTTSSMSNAESTSTERAASADSAQTTTATPFVRFLKTLGPGLLFASTAIGVSHLVQSTRAGASYGYALLWAVVVANLLKYPAFESAPRYTNATGESLIDGYLRLGNWMLYVYLLITIAPMFIINAAIGFTTAGLLNNLFGLDISVATTALFLLAFCVGVLLVGEYSLLDNLIKIICGVLFVSTVVAFILTLARGPVAEVSFYSSEIWTVSGFAFLIALMGWMPAPVDLAAWNSLWTLERIKQTNYKPVMKETLLDFNIGYMMTAFLAVCFMTLGAFIMYGSGESFSNQSGTQFTNQVVQLYTATLGDWSYIIIAASAFSVMFSTTLVVLDGYARAMERTCALLFFNGENSRRMYNLWVIISAIGAYFIIAQFLTSFTTLVDLATVISFLVAPILAAANYRLVFGGYMPEAAQPPEWLRILGIIGIIFLSVFTLIYVGMRLLS